MFTLKYQATSMVLPNPTFGNIYRIDTQRVLRNSRRGGLLEFQESTWPKIGIQVYQFIDLDKVKTTNLIDFYISSAGQSVTIDTDHLGQIWNGFIISQPVDIVTQHDDCSYDINLEFQGVKQ